MCEIPCIFEYGNENVTFSELQGRTQWGHRGVQNRTGRWGPWARPLEWNAGLSPKTNNTLAPLAGGERDSLTPTLYLKSLLLKYVISDHSLMFYIFTYFFKKHHSDVALALSQRLCHPVFKVLCVLLDSPKSLNFLGLKFLWTVSP